MWYRVFGTNDAKVEPAALLEHLHAHGFDVEGHFHGDEQGWFRADLVLAGAPPLDLERYLATEEGIRAELNTWAASIELADDGPSNVGLMQHMISTTQLFTLSHPTDRPDQAVLEKLCVLVCSHLARESGGIYQMDGRGFFSEDGTRLLKEVADTAM